MCRETVCFPFFRPVIFDSASLMPSLLEWVCATCSGALSDMERQTLKFVFGMCAITVLSFTWFAGGCGVLF